MLQCKDEDVLCSMSASQMNALQLVLIGLYTGNTRKARVPVRHKSNMSNMTQQESGISKTLTVVSRIIGQCLHNTLALLRRFSLSFETTAPIAINFSFNHKIPA